MTLKNEVHNLGKYKLGITSIYWVNLTMISWYYYYQNNETSDQHPGFFTLALSWALRKNPVITRKKKKFKDLENFAKLTKCMLMHLVSFLPGFLPGLNYIL